METKFNGVIPHPSSPPIYTELMWLAIFLVFVAVLVWRHRKRTELSNTALMFIGAGSMFWQEYYNNWGGYLLYSPDLHLWPWGSTWWTAPNKPMFILVSYAPFFTLIYSGLTFLNGKISQALPRVPLLAISFLVNGPLFWLWNYGIDKSSVESGVWNYVVTWGPTVVLGRVDRPTLDRGPRRLPCRHDGRRGRDRDGRRPDQPADGQRAAGLADDPILDLRIACRLFPDEAR